MTTTSKQLRRKHRKNPKPHKQGSPTSHISGLERLQALEPAYIGYRSRTVTPEQARIEWTGLRILLGSLAGSGKFNAADVFDSKSIMSLLVDALREPDHRTCLNLQLLDGYLHFLQDTGRWPRANDSFELMHLLVLMRIPRVVDRRTSIGCPSSFPNVQGHGLTLVQWAAYLLDEMLDGKFNPESHQSLAYPVQGPDDVVLLAPGLFPLPFTVFKDLFNAMDKADLFDRSEEQSFWDADEDIEQAEEDGGDLYPTSLGMALMQDDHPQNHEAIHSLLTSYLRIVTMAHASGDADLAGLRRADLFMSVLGAAATKSSTVKAEGETNMLSIGEQTKEQVANQFGEISASILACIKAGVLEYVDGSLIAHRLIREAIRNLRKEYVGATSKN